MARSALAPPMRTLLDQALHPEGDSALEASVDDIIHGLKKLKSNREMFHEADEFYDGTLGMVWASERVKRILDRQGGLVEINDFNYASIPVDRIAARLQISSVQASPAEENQGTQAVGEDAASEAANKQIAGLRKINELDAEEKRLHHLASLYGSAYLLVWPGTDDDGNATVDIRVNSPHHVVMIYDEEDQLKPSYALKAWDKDIDGKPVTRANLYYPDRIERWTTKPGGSPEKEESWFKLVDAEDSREFDIDEEDLEELAEDEFSGDADNDQDENANPNLDLGDIPNPWGRVPFFHFRNDRPDGRPEHKNAYGPQQLINKLVWGLAGTIDYTTFPQRYILQDPSVDDPMLNLSDPDHPDLDDDDIEDEGGNAGLDADPGSVWKLWGKSVGEFSTAQLGSFLEALDRVVRSMAELTGLPVNAFSRATADLPSGESIREANADFIATITDRQDRYEPTWQDAYEFALKILGITNVSVDIRWKPAQQVNDSAGWSVIQMKINSGVPPQVALEEAGYGPEQVDEWLKDATGADLGRRVTILGQIATATQALGASIVTGAVSAEQVQALIAALFADVLAGTDHKLPEAKDFVDPQAALKAQQAMQDKQLAAQQQAQQAQQTHATQSQQAQQTHASQTQQTAHQLSQQSADAAHQRNLDMMKRAHQEQGQQQGQPVGGNGRNGRRPGGR